MSASLADVNRIKVLLLEECETDEVGLWSVIWEVRCALNGGKNPAREDDLADPETLRRITMGLVQELLVSGKVQAGYYSPDGSGWKPWSLTPAETLSRINSEWDAVGRDPTIGEVVVFMANQEKQ